MPHPTIPRRLPGSGRRPLLLWPALVLWTGLWTLPHLLGRGGGVSWHFFDHGAASLLSGGAAGGLHLYAAHPGLQIGPLSFLVAAPLRLSDPWHGRVVATALMTGMGPLLLHAAARLRSGDEGVRPARLLAAGLIFLPLWCEVSTHFAHLDDVLALAFGLAALRAAQASRPVATGLLLAAAADSKPWAAAFVPLVLALPRGGRLRAAGAWLAGIAAAWLPFLVADPGTFRAARFAIPNVPASALRAIGVTAARTPIWDRPVQIAVGAGLGAVAVRRGRWTAVLLVAIAVRLLLDPETYPYYTSGLVLAAVIVDLVETERVVPVLGLAAVILVYGVRLTDFDPQADGFLRAACLLALAGAAVLGRSRAGAAPVPFLPRLAFGRGADDGA